MEQDFLQEVPVSPEGPNESIAAPVDWKRRFDKQTEFFSGLIREKDEEILELEKRLASPEIFPERVLELSASTNQKDLQKAEHIAREVYGIDIATLTQALTDILTGQDTEEDHAYLQMIQEFNIRKQMEIEALMQAFMRQYPLLSVQSPEYSQTISETFYEALKKLAPRPNLLPKHILEDHLENAYLIATKGQYAKQTSDAIRKKLEIDEAIKKSVSRNTASHKSGKVQGASPFASLPKSL